MERDLSMISESLESNNFMVDPKCVLRIVFRVSCFVFRVWCLVFRASCFVFRVSCFVFDPYYLLRIVQISDHGASATCK